MGKGAYGLVHKVIRSDNNIVYAAKVHLKSKGVGGYDEAVNEAKKLGSYSHKNLVKLIESFDQMLGGIKTHVIILEYCNGIDSEVQTLS